MNRMSNRVLLLLASSGLNEADFEEFGEWYDQVGMSRFLHSVSSLRNLQRKFAPDALGVDKDFADRGYRTAHSPSEDIAQLLRRDAGLSATEAAEYLVSRLQRRKDVPRDMLASIPPLNKSSFNSWLARLSRQVPYSILLQEATLIRNELTHRLGRADWPLKQGDL